MAMVAGRIGSNLARYAVNRYGGYGALAKRAAPAFAGMLALRGAKRQKISSSSAGAGGAAVLTNQYDVQNFYRKRRMPRRKRRAWRKFYKKVASVYRKETSGKSSLLLRGQIDGTVAAGQQGCIGAMLFGAANANSTTDFGAADQNYIQDSIAGVAATNVSPLVKSATMDIEITNRGITDYAATLTVDVYKVYCTRTVTGINAAQVLGWTDLFGQALAMEPTCGGSTDIGGNNVAGVSPFMAADFCRHVKIVSHKRVILSVGQTAEFMLRDPKDHKLFWSNPSSTKGCGLEKGLTKGFMFIFQGVAGTGTKTQACSYSITCNRTYQVANTADNVKRSGYRDVI